jgi:hypothetical protein
MKRELVTKKEPIVSRPPLGEITDPKVARALAGAATRRYLTPFFAGERTASEAAQQLRLPLRPYCNKIEGLLRLGLLRETRSVPRKGRAVRYFMTSAQEFFIPMNAITEDMIIGVENRYQRQFIDCLLTVGANMGATGPAPLGFRVHAGEVGNGDAMFDLAARPGVTLNMLEKLLPPFFTSWSVLELDAADARGLQAELVGLLARYQARSKPGGTRYLTRWGLARLPESS